MDTTTSPNRSIEEETQSQGQAGRQTMRTKRAEGPTQVSQEVQSAVSTPSGSSQRVEQSVGMSPAAAHEYTRKKNIFRTYQGLWYVLGLVEILLAFRFFLKLTGANPHSGFASFIYGITLPFAGPFLGTFRASQTQGAETAGFFEWSTLLAALVYALVVWGIVKLVQFSKPTNPEEVERGVAQT